MFARLWRRFRMWSGVQPCRIPFIQLVPLDEDGAEFEARVAIIPHWWATAEDRMVARSLALLMIRDVIGPCQLVGPVQPPEGL